ncbi:MAG: hypothetical protein WAT79_03845, partial [Saprospiraceae bacterium]
MKKFSQLLSILFAFILTGNVFGQITISGGSNVNGPYATIAAAVTALNGATISGAVTVNVNAGHTETLSNRINLTATGTAVNTITIQKSGAGVNPLITAFTGLNLTSSLERDGLFSITGGDYITIDGIDLQENGSNTTPTELMEYGYGLFKENGTNGCQHVTIKNSTVSLSTANFASWSGVGHFGSIAIVVLNCTPTNNVALTTTSQAGSNSFNSFANNTLQNVHSGIALVGYIDSTPFDFSDYGNTVGGNVLADGNSILNYGGGAGANTASAGVYTSQQRDINVSFNEISNNNGLGNNHPNILYGIWAAASVSASATFNHNNLDIKGGGTTQAVTAIRNEAGSTPASNTVEISNNAIRAEYLSATSGALYGIWNSASSENLNMNNNTLTNFSYGTILTTGTGVLYGIYNSTSNAAMVVNANNNTLNNFSRSGTSGGTTIGIAFTVGTTGMNVSISNNTVRNLSIDGTGTASTLYGIQSSTGTIVVNDNLVENLSCLKSTGTSALYGMYNISSPVNETFNNNIIRNLSHRGTGITYGFYANTTSGTRTVAGNLVHTITSGSTTVAGMNFLSSSPNIFNNKIYDIESTSSAAPVVSGIILGSVGTAGTANIYNNYIGDVRAGSASSTNANTPTIRGINVTVTTTNSNINISYNSVLINASSIGANFATAGLFVTTSATATTANLNLLNNIFVNNSIPSGTGNTVAYQRSTTSVSNYNDSSNNNLFYAGTPGINHLIFFDGTDSDQTINEFKCRVQPRESSSITENPSFLSITGSSINFLHINPSIATGIESGGINVSGILDDFDGDIRQGNLGYGGAGIGPDIGADEGEFMFSDVVGPSISYTILGNSICTNPLSLDADIVDGSGINNTPGSKPRLWYKKSTENNSLAVTNTSASNGWKWVEATNATSPYNFVFDYSILTSPVVGGDQIQYFMVAQDLAAVPNVASNLVIFNACGIPTSVALGTTLFPVTGTNSFDIIPTPNTILSLVSPGSICLTGDVTLSLSQTNLGAEYQWQSSPMGANIWTNIPGATTESYVFMGINSSTDFRCNIMCNGSPIVASPSQVVTVVVSMPEILSTTPGSACGPGPVSVELGATANMGAEIRWYENPTGGSNIGTGGTFNTPPINTTTTYYVAASDGGSTLNVGLPQSLPTATSGAGTTNFGIVFDVLAPCVLETVTVYAIASTIGTVGTVTIDVVDGSGAILHTATVNVTGNPVASSMPDVVTLNFNLTPGTNYKLRPGARGPGITGLLFEPSAAAPSGNYGYPFSIPGYITLNHSTLTAPPTNTPRLDLYYYFYNWTIITGCESERTGVLASIINDVPICPNNFEVCINTTPFMLTGATPLDGEYTGPGVVNGVFNPSIAGLGIHTITYTACNLTCTFDITVNSIPTATITISDMSGSSDDDGIICIGDDATLIASGGTGYLWSNGETTATITVSPLTTTTYTVTVTNNGCSSFTSTTITVNPIPTALIAVSDMSGTTNDDGIICAGSTADLTASGGTDYLWSTGAITASISVSPLTTTTYFVTVSDMGCSSSISTSITVNPNPSVSIMVMDMSGTSNDDGIICAGSTANLTASGGTDYLWSTGAITTSISVSPLTTTTYFVTVSDNGCNTSTSREIIVNPIPNQPIITITNNVCPSLMGSISASSCGGSAILEWALSPMGPWSTTAPTYTTSPFTVYARCNNLTTGCISLTANATTAPVVCSMDCMAPSFSSCSTAVSESFTSFGGAGFSLSPSGTQLCTNTWAWTGWSDGSKAFGVNATTGDYARGNTVAGSVTTGGVYSLNNGALYIQPGGSDWAPGTATFRIQNNSGGIIEAIDLAYDILVRNDQARSNSFNFSYSIDGTNFTNIPALDYTSPLTADPTPIVINSVPRTYSLTGLSILDGNFIYFRWSGADVGGSGSRDEFGLDNLLFTAVCNTCPTMAVISGDGTFCDEGNISDIPVIVNISDGIGPFTLVISESGNNFTVLNYQSGDPIDRAIFETQTYTLVSVTDANGCSVPLNSLSGTATVTQINCDCPLITITSLTQTCTDIGIYSLKVSFTADGLMPGDKFLLEIGGLNYGPYFYAGNESQNPMEYCITLQNLVEDAEMNIEVFVHHLAAQNLIPIIDGSSTVEPEWGSAYSISDGSAGWAGVNVGNLYLNQDAEY